MCRFFLDALGAVALFVWAIAPSRATNEQKAPFCRKNFAHRGLHTPDKSVPENSLEAFRLAKEAGYGSELDVQLSSDGQVFVFHDDSLDRVTGVSGVAEAFPWETLSKTHLCGTEQTIPLFSDVLKEMDGKVPLIVELKTTKRYKELSQKTLDLLRDYRQRTGGDFCVESFDFRIVRWFRFHAPDILRGQLSSRAAGIWKKEGSFGYKTAKWLNASVLFNGLARPHFIAYDIVKKPFPVRAAEAMGAMRVSWTSLPEKREQAESTSDAVIFQFYEPPVRF